MKYLHQIKNVLENYEIIFCDLVKKTMCVPFCIQSNGLFVENQ